jgi:hypothetical protein
MALIVDVAVSFAICRAGDLDFFLSDHPFKPFHLPEIH